MISFSCTRSIRAALALPDGSVGVCVCKGRTGLRGRGFDKTGDIWGEDWDRSGQIT